MISPEEFMQNYFSARTELYREEIERRRPHRSIFFTQTCVYDSRNKTIEISQNEKVLSITQLDGEAEVITSGVALRGERMRMRYRLAPTAEGWRINRVNWECRMCQATGKRKDRECFSCKGKGWWGGD